MDLRIDTDPRILELLGALRSGALVRDAADQAGIPLPTLKRWRRSDAAFDRAVVEAAAGERGIHPVRGVGGLRCPGMCGTTTGYDYGCRDQACSTAKAEAMRTIRAGGQRVRFATRDRRDQYVLDRYEAGDRLAEIASAVGLSERMITKILRRAEVPRRLAPVKLVGREEDIVARYRAGVSLRQIAEELGASQTGIRKVLKRAGVT